MDKYDRKILSVLSIEGRISMTALGERVGLSKTPVTARVKRFHGFPSDPFDAILQGSGVSLSQTSGLARFSAV